MTCGLRHSVRNASRSATWPTGSDALGRSPNSARAGMVSVCQGNAVSRGCAGVMKSRVFRGRPLSSAAMASSSSWVRSAKRYLRGRYWRNRPLVFSWVPRCPGLRGSQKNTGTPLATSIGALICVSPTTTESQPSSTNGSRIARLCRHRSHGRANGKRASANGSDEGTYLESRGFKRHRGHKSSAEVDALASRTLTDLRGSRECCQR